MSALVMEQAVLPFLEPRSDEGSLDALITGAWSELGRHHPIGCPVCGEEMAPTYGVHARPVGGRCGACGSELR